RKTKLTARMLRLEQRACRLSTTAITAHRSRFPFNMLLGVYMRLAKTALGITTLLCILLGALQMCSRFLQLQRLAVMTPYPGMHRVWSCVGAPDSVEILYPEMFVVYEEDISNYVP